MHLSGISTGFISSLGLGFVATLYEAISEDKNCFGLVAVENENVIGFVAFSSNLSKQGKGIAKQLTQAGFEECRKRGIDKVKVLVAADNAPANKLYQKCGFEECRKRSIEKVKVLVAAENEPANKLYQSIGFKLTHTIQSHGTPSNIYIKQL